MFPLNTLSVKDIFYPNVNPVNKFKIYFVTKINSENIYLLCERDYKYGITFAKSLLYHL